MYAARRILPLLSLLAVGLLTGACASSADPDEASGSDALSASECSGIVKDQLAASVKACDASKGDKATIAGRIDMLFRAVGDAHSAFATELSSYTGNGAGTVQAVVAECSAVKCGGELARPDGASDCTIEHAFLAAACYTRNAPRLTAAATDLDFSQEISALKTAYEDLVTEWPSLKAQEVALWAQHAACSTYAGSSAQEAKLYATCRSSCNAEDATSVGSVLTGWGNACVPAGFESVKDDLGKEVSCGTYKRPVLSAGTICECRVTDACTQFAAVGQSSERGKACEGGKTKKLSWNAEKKTATLECL